MNYECNGRWLVEDASCRMMEPAEPIMSTLAPQEAKSYPIEINGYAIVSDDDRIAGADGLIPASLRNEKDWDCFQRALARSDLVVIGHRSHELAPNVRGDQRLVISRGAVGLEQHADVWWWNPKRHCHINRFYCSLLAAPLDSDSIESMA
jgi:hypothetical protein